MKSVGLFMPIGIGLCSRLYSRNVPALGGIATTARSSSVKISE